MEDQQTNTHSTTAENIHNNHNMMTSVNSKTPPPPQFTDWSWVKVIHDGDSEQVDVISLPEAIDHWSALSIQDFMELIETISSNNSANNSAVNSPRFGPSISHLVTTNPSSTSSTMALAGTTSSSATNDYTTHSNLSTENGNHSCYSSFSDLVLQNMNPKLHQHSSHPKLGLKNVMNKKKSSSSLSISHHYEDDFIDDMKHHDNYEYDNNNHAGCEEGRHLHEQVNSALDLILFSSLDSLAIDKCSTRTTSPIPLSLLTMALQHHHDHHKKQEQQKEHSPERSSKSNTTTMKSLFMPQIKYKNRALNDDDDSALEEHLLESSPYTYTMHNENNTALILDIPKLNLPSPISPIDNLTKEPYQFIIATHHHKQHRHHPQNTMITECPSCSNTPSYVANDEKSTMKRKYRHHQQQHNQNNSNINHQTNNQSAENGDKKQKLSWIQNIIYGSQNDEAQCDQDHHNVSKHENKKYAQNSMVKVALLYLDDCTPEYVKPYVGPWSVIKLVGLMAACSFSGVILIRTGILIQRGINSLFSFMF